MAHSEASQHSLLSSDGASGENPALYERNRHRYPNLNVLSGSYNKTNYQNTTVQSHNQVTYDPAPMSVKLTYAYLLCLVSALNLNLWLRLMERKSNTSFLYLLIQYTTLLIIPVSRGFYPKLSNWLLSQWLWPVQQLTSSFGVFKCFAQVSAASESRVCKSLWLSHIVSGICFTCLCRGMQWKHTADTVFAHLTGKHTHWTVGTQHETCDQSLLTDYNRL